MPFSRVSHAKRSPLLLLALLAAACDDGAAPAATVDFDPTLDLDAESNPAEVDEDAGVPPRDAAALDGGRQDAGSQPPRDATPGDAAPVDAEPASDARRVEQAAFEAVERLMVADGRASRVHVLDVPSRSYLESFDLKGLGPIYAGASGRYGYVLESAWNRVQIVSSGLPDPAQASVPMLSAPSLSGAELSGLSPSTLAAHGDQVVLLFAGAAQLASFTESTLSAARPDHTFALGATTTSSVLLHLGDELLVSESDASGGPSRLRLVDRMLSALDGPRLSCVDPEGAALSEGTVAVACADGVLRWNGVESSGATLPYPSDAAGERAHKLAPNPLVRAFLTTLGDRVCLVQNDAFTCVPAPAAGVVDYAFDPTGKRALVLARSGTLHVLEAGTLGERATLPLLPALAADTPARELPDLAVGRRFVYVSHPAGGTIQIVDGAGARFIGELTVPGGVPTEIAVFKYAL